MNYAIPLAAYTLILTVAVAFVFYTQKQIRKSIATVEDKCNVQVRESDVMALTRRLVEERLEMMEEDMMDVRVEDAILPSPPSPVPLPPPSPTPSPQIEEIDAEEAPAIPKEVDAEAVEEAAEDADDGVRRRSSRRRKEDT
jgi:hypothetical protein